jgi:hypothetical protein
MRDIMSGFMKRHLAAETVVDGRTVRNQPIDDPFATTMSEIDIRFSLLDRIKLLFTGRHHVQVLHKIVGDSIAIKRWFEGKDACDWCGTTIGFPNDGSSEADPGYHHHGDERLCERCYCKPESKASAVDCCDQQSTVAGR